MEQRFESIEELRDFLDFLEMKGREIPQWVLNEKDRLERESEINDEEYIFSTMKANNPFMTEEKEKLILEWIMLWKSLMQYFLSHSLRTITMTF